MRRGFASDIKPHHPDGSQKNYVDLFTPDQEAFAMFVICIYYLGNGELSISKECFFRYKVYMTLCLFSFVSVLYNVFICFAFIVACFLSVVLFLSYLILFCVLFLNSGCSRIYEADLAVAPCRGEPGTRRVSLGLPRRLRCIP